MTKKIFFFSGLPRSGSTVLGSILSQHPEISVTPTSPLLDLLCYTNQAFNEVNQKYTYDEPVVTKNVYTGLIESFYKNYETPIVFDKHRGWATNIVPIKMFITENPKIICTNRPVSEVIASYIKLINQNNGNNFVDDTLAQRGLQPTLENRATCLWNQYISDPYNSMAFGLSQFRQYIHVVPYNELTENPDQTIKNIYDFLEIEPFKHDFNNIVNTCAEDKDDAWGLENLHTIRPVLGKTSTPPEEILGEYLTHYYNQFNLT
jgi:sulfotransferase